MPKILDAKIVRLFALFGKKTKRRELGTGSIDGFRLILCGLCVRCRVVAGRMNAKADHHAEVCMGKLRTRSEGK